MLYFTTTSDGPAPSLTPLNYVNLLAFIANAAVTYISMTGVFGPTNSQLSKKYQALVTPAGWAFSIWGPIFILEAVFAIYQMFGNVRASETVEAIAYPYMWSCFAQIMWTIVFAQEWIGVSLFFMLSILVALMWMQYS